MPTGLIRLTGAAVALGAILGVAAEWRAGEWRAGDAAARFLRAMPGVSVASVRVNWRGGVELQGIAAHASWGRARIGRLRVATGGGIFDRVSAALVPSAHAWPADGPAAAPAAGQAPGVATAENISIDYQGVTYTIPRIELAGTTLTNADLAAMLDVNAAPGVEARLRRITAASISIPEIKADTAAGDFEQHWDQQQVLIAGVKDGKAASGSAGPGILKTKSAKGTSVAETGGLQMTGIDMGQIVHVATTARTDDAEAKQTLAASLVVTAIRLHNDGQGSTVTVATLKEAGLKARSLALISQARSLLLATGKPGDPAVDAFVDDIAASVSVDLLQVDDLALTPDKTAADGPMRLRRLTVTDVHDRRVGTATLQGVRFDQKGNHVSLADAEMNGVTLPARSDGKGAPAVAGITLTDLAIDTDTADEGQPEKRFAMTVGRAGYTAAGAAPGVLPPASTTTVDDLKITVRPDMSPTLIALGYPTVGLSSRLSTTFDAATRVLRIDDWTVNGAGMGKAALKLQLGNVSDAVVSSDADAQKAAVAAVLFRGIGLTIDDAGLVDKLIGYHATKDGITVAQERANAVDLVRNKLPVLAGDPAKLKPVEDAVARFIADPTLPLHIGITSDPGLGAGDAGLLGDPNALLDRLAIVASAGR